MLIKPTEVAFWEEILTAAKTNIVKNFENTKEYLKSSFENKLQSENMSRITRPMR